MKVTNFIEKHFYFIIGIFFAFISGGIAIDALIH